MRTHTCRSLLLAALTLTLIGGRAEAQHRMRMPDATDITVTASDGVPEIPFKLINNHLILPLSVNGSPPLDVVLDTGMPAPGLALYDSPEVAALELTIDPSMNARIGGAGGDGRHFSAQVAREESFAMPGLSADKVPVIIMPEMPGFTGYHDGIIGYSLFSRFVVELDYDNQVMRLLDPETYRAPEGSRTLPITLRSNLPYVTLGVTLGGASFDAEVVVDLGASHAISLNTDEMEKIRVPERALTAVVGRGLSGPVKGEIARVPELRLAGARLENVVASFPVSEHQNPRGVDSLAGNLGSDVLRRFNTTFDYAGLRLILQPNTAYGEPFGYDRSGIRLGYGVELTIESLIEGSPADESGLRIDDVITHVNGAEVEGGDYGEVRKALMGSGEVRLSIRRGDETLDRSVSLRRLI